MPSVTSLNIGRKQFRAFGEHRIHVFAVGLVVVNHVIVDFPIEWQDHSFGRFCNKLLGLTTISLRHSDRLSGWFSAIIASSQTKPQNPLELEFFNHTPFFIACDHGCYHGEATHGVGLDHDYGEIESARDLDRQTVVNLCYEAIQSADLIFAWLDNDTAYGTLVEIGYALGHGKPVYVCFAPDQALLVDMWFAATSAIRVMADNPTDGLVLALHQNRFRDRRN